MSSGFIFDVDGTLIDSVDLHAHAWQVALAHFGFNVSYDAVRSQIGKGGDQLLPVFVPRDQLERLQESMEQHRGELFKREYLARVKPFPRVRELFERVKQDGHRIALASSAKADELEEYKRIAGITDLIDVETSSDDVDRSKPCPDVFQVALARLGIEPAAGLVFGDSPFDAIAAVRAGLNTVGVLCGGFPEEQLREAGCVAIFRDPSDLVDRYDEVSRFFTRALRTP
jgi:HAD superfamily hydrolase (TIGR01509 family)